MNTEQLGSGTTGLWMTGRAWLNTKSRGNFKYRWVPFLIIQGIILSATVFLKLPMLSMKPLISQNKFSLFTFEMIIARLITTHRQQDYFPSLARGKGARLLCLFWVNWGGDLLRVRLPQASPFQTFKIFCRSRQTAPMPPPPTANIVKPWKPWTRYVWH